MDIKFYIVDDDKGIRRILENIIIEHNMGEIIGESGSGKNAVEAIKQLQPDIVLVDLLLPDIDGISIVSAINEIDLDISFIMISRVDSMEMIDEAYDNKIEFYIKKPINAKEVYSVINNVKEKIRMKNIIEDIDRAVSRAGEFRHFLGKPETVSYSSKDKIKNIFFQLGISAESGSKDLAEIILLLTDSNDTDIINKYKMYEIYNRVSKKYLEIGKENTSARSIEQRVRRAVKKAMKNIANLAIEDYSNEIFEKYSNSLFDFEEVRNEMSCIRKKSEYNGKINIRKFIEGIVIEINKK